MSRSRDLSDGWRAGSVEGAGGEHSEFASLVSKAEANLSQHPSSFTVYQAGDGQRYAVNIPMVKQFAASAVRALVNDRHSKIVVDYAPPDVFGRKAPFKSVSFDGNSARKEFDSLVRQRYSTFWECFQNNGPAAKLALLRMREAANLRIGTLSKKFEECGQSNSQVLQSLDDRVSTARFVRDAGFTVVGAWATGGMSLGTIAMGTGAKVVIGTAVLKAGSKMADLGTEGKLNSIDGGLILVDFAADLMFAAVGGSGALNGAKETLLFIACTKAPLEMAKSAATGGNLKQILFAGGFEMMGPALDGLKEKLASTLFPGLCKITVGAHADVAIGAAKDKTMGQLANASSGAPVGTFDSLLSFFGLFELSDKHFIDRYVLVKQ